MKWIEYRVHWGEDGESYQFMTYKGADWRKWKQHIGEEGVVLIERVTCTESMPSPHEEYEILWEEGE